MANPNCARTVLFCLVPCAALPGAIAIWPWIRRTFIASEAPPAFQMQPHGATASVPRPQVSVETPVPASPSEATPAFQMQPQGVATSVPPPVSVERSFETGATSDAVLGHVQLRRILAESLLNNTTQPAAVRDYAMLYHEEFSGRQLVFFLHVSKASGTEFCECGKSSGCRAEPTNRIKGTGNCNDPVVDIQLWFAGSAIDAKAREKFSTCAGLAKRYAARNWTLEGNEGYLLPASGICPQFWNVIIVRDPISRLLSHLKMLYSWHQKFPPETLTPDHIFKKAHRLSNNYHIRVLSGRDAFFSPFGEISERHFETALTLLRKFDLVFSMGSSNTSLTTLLERALGWTCTECALCKRLPWLRDKSGVTTAVYRARLNWTERDWSMLRAASSWDMKLKEHADTLARLDESVFVHDSFSTFQPTCPRRSGESCGFLCK